MPGAPRDPEAIRDRKSVTRNAAPRVEANQSQPGKAGVAKRGMAAEPADLAGAAGRIVRHD